MTNYPWAGLLGRIANCCLYCGDAGPSFSISSRPTSCVKCAGRGEPIPELKAEYLKRRDELAREWCIKNNMDYDAIIQSMGADGNPYYWPTK